MTTSSWLTPAGADISDDDLDAAQRWAGESLAMDGHHVLSWQSTTDQPIDADEGWAPTLA